MLIFTILKLLIVAVFLVIFLRRLSLVWGVGLLTVTSAVLLDTFLGVFNREEMIAQMGFFFYVIAGLLIGGGAFWLLGLLRPSFAMAPGAPTAVSRFRPITPPRPAMSNHAPSTPFDRQMLFDEIRTKLSLDDLFDLMFDLEMAESDVMQIPQPLNDLIVQIMDLAHEREMDHQLALAVERILTPPPDDHLPRLVKISVDSPPTILRHYLLATYNLNELHRFATRLGIDYEQLDRHNKKIFVRNLLQYLSRRERTGELITLMQRDAQTVVSEEP